MSELKEVSPPEIRRANLNIPVLTLKKCGIQDLVSFDFLEPPFHESLMRSLQELYHLDMLDGDGNITDIGHLASEFPLEPQLAKMLIESPKYNCCEEILSIAAMLSVKNVFFRPREADKKAEKCARQKFVHPEGDHLTLLNTFNVCSEALHDRQQETQFFQSNYVHAWSFKEAQKVRSQLQRTMRHLHLDTMSHNTNPEGNHINNIEKCIVAGFFMQVAHLEKAGHYTTIKDHRCLQRRHSQPFSRSCSAFWERRVVSYM